MGGVQSSAHSLGDALWMQERQRQQGQREGDGRYESQDVQDCGSHDRRQLLKRTRSLAVISEDSSRKERESRHFCLSEHEFEIPRRPQLIPRAKLIDRNSLKDRLSKSQQHLSESYDRFNESRSYHSRSTCELYSVPPALSSLPDPPLYGRTSRADPDRLNILDWPRTPRRHRSHQDLDTVSGLVDIVEDNWPIDENHQDRGIDCIYTQVKRKRKEHRSLDSILLEDDDELEYFDVLNLLPLSKVRLEIDESDDPGGDTNFVNNNTNHRVAGRRSREFATGSNNGGVILSERDDDELEDLSIDHSELSEYRSSNGVEITEACGEKAFDFGNNFTDEEKCKSQPTKEYPEIVEFHERRDNQQSWRSLTSYSGQKPIEDGEVAETFESSAYTSDFAGNEIKKVNIILESSSTSETESGSASGTDYREEHNGETDEPVLVTTLKEVARRNEVEEAEDYKSIWISDTEEPDDMSRRPQVLTVVDNEVTRKRGRASDVVEIDIVARERPVSKDRHVAQTEINSQSEFGQTNSSDVKKNVHVEDNVGMKLRNEDKTDMETARDFFEKKSSGKDTMRNRRHQGRFERIVKETSNILGKACNAFRGSLGFEAGSESSDLGLGSDCGSDSRRRSIDDGVDVVDDAVSALKNSVKPSKDEPNHNDDGIANSGRKSRTNLTRSRSCVDSIESQEESGAEFDHVRYKIVKSRLFGKNIFGNTVNKGDVTYDGLMEYLREYSFQELLLDNNVVIIEPVRAETVERKPSSIGAKNRSNGGCKVAEIDTKKETDGENSDGNDEKTNGDANSSKGPKQSSLRKHFFYHPIRVNKELIDEELPDPDTVRNVRRMFENTVRSKSASKVTSGVNCKSRKSVSMKDLRRIEERGLDDVNERTFEASSRSRCSSRAKDLTRLFESLDKTTPNQTNQSGKVDPGSPRSETKTRMLAQSFEARSGNTSPSDAGSTRNKASRCRHQNHHHHCRQRQNNWDAGSVSSGVSSDYPDTDQGSGVHCTSSEDEEIDSRDDYESRESERVSGPFVSQDVLKKIRECGTSVTYYGGKVVNTCNGPLISPMSCKLAKRNERAFLGDEDYVKFRLVKSNSCDSRLELTGRVIERRSRLEARESASRAAREKSTDLRESTIDETPSIEITATDGSSRIALEEKEKLDVDEKRETKREPPIVVGLEPKKEENREANGFKADFKLGKIEDTRLGYVNRFGSALTKWQINETNWKKTNADFGKMEFEEFEVLEDSLNGNEN